jgi:hypothetical protein
VRTDTSLAAIAFGAILILVLAFCARSSINIGVRHVVPLYPALCGLAALAIADIWRQAKNAPALKVAMLGVALWLLSDGLLNHPHYIAYFNELAMHEPERIAVDSNLDWGQDLVALGDFFKAHHIDSAHLLIAASANFGNHGVNGDWLPPYVKSQGWIAVSHTARTLSDCRGTEYRWLQAYRPVAKVGRSIEVFYIP